jgi:hypothetical protein
MVGKWWEKGGKKVGKRWENGGKKVGKWENRKHGKIVIFDVFLVVFSSALRERPNFASKS